MSGFEVVGAVLGSIPLIIGALEHYADGVSTIKSMKEYENVFLDSQSRLVLSMAIFRRSCRELVRDLPDKQIRDLVDLRKGWDDPALMEILQRRLGEDFAIYRVSVKRLNKRVELLQRKLELRGDLTAPFMEGDIIDGRLCKKFFNPWRRIRGGLNAEKHKQLVVEILDDIDRLCNFTKGAIDLEDADCRELSLEAPSYWLDIQSHTHRFYDTLRSTWPQSCSSHTHRAKLRLDVPQGDEIDCEPPQFNFSFSLGDNTASLRSLLWEWREVRVLSFRTLPPPVSQNRTSTPPHTPSKKTARFALPDIAVDPVQTPKVICTSNIKIGNLCTTLKQSCQKEFCLGLLSCHEWHYHVHDTANRARRLTPLKEILHHQNPENITTRQKRTFALALASGVLQLYDTPWLRDVWTLDDIYLDLDEGNDHLYVVRTFDPEPFNKQQTPSSFAGDQLLVKNRTLFSLGVALLELSYGAPLSARQTAEDLKDAFTQYRIASRLTKKIQDDELPRFASVVGKCMYPTPENYDFSFANEGFRRRYFQEVVLPLAEDYKELPSRKFGIGNEN